MLTSILSPTGTGRPFEKRALHAGKAPMVRRTKWVEHRNLVPWSQDEAAVNRGHVAAGMQLLRQLDEYRQKGKPTTLETKALLDLAERAISAKHQPPKEQHR
jgi:hypothetical protein